MPTLSRLEVRSTSTLSPNGCSISIEHKRNRRHQQAQTTNKSQRPMHAEILIHRHRHDDHWPYNKSATTNSTMDEYSRYTHLLHNTL